MDAIALTKQLVDIPSFVHTGYNESRLTTFVTTWIKRHLPHVSIRSFVTAPCRSNLLILPHKRMEVLLTAHMDTVLPAGHWRSSHIARGRLYGTGSVDMKSAMAAMLIALKEAGRDGRAGMLLYVDEEYAFAGIKTILRKLQSIPKPSLILAGEPTDGKISNGCRGIATIEIEIRGCTAHSARPQNGRNTADAFFLVKNTIDQLASSVRHPNMGATLANVYHAELGLAHIDGACTTIAASDNRVPDILRLGASFRITDSHVRLIDWKVTLQKILRARGFRLSGYHIGHAYMPMYTETHHLKKFIPLLKSNDRHDPFVDLRTVGYYDIQMLAEAWKVPAISIGCGPRATAHSPNEYVRCSDVLSMVKLYTSVVLTGKRVLD